MATGINKNANVRLSVPSAEDTVLVVAKLIVTNVAPKNLKYVRSEMSHVGIGYHLQHYG